jgi:hypothetical protein
VTLLQEVDLEDRFLRPISRENEALRGAFLAPRHSTPARPGGSLPPLGRWAGCWARRLAL